MDFLSSLFSPIANIVGGIFGRQSSEDIAARNIAAQQEFAQHGISWKVADAKAAGINPLAALGASTSSFSNIVGDNSLGQGIAAAGQDMSRAAAANSSRVLRAADLDAKLTEAKINNVNADTIRQQAEASKISRTYASPGSSSGINYSNVPLPRARSDVLTPLFTSYDDGRGGIVELPTDKASQAMQNWASMPAQVAVAAGGFGRSLHEMSKATSPDLLSGVYLPHVMRNVGVDPYTLGAMY